MEILNGTKCLSLQLCYARFMFHTHIEIQTLLRW